MSTKLFEPIRVGDVQLQHRVVMAPMTRFRADERGVLPDMAVEYYAQRASTPGTLIISEAAIIAEKAGGYDHVPGIWTDEQIQSWRKVTDAVHSKGSHIFCQLWALGRAANPEVLARHNIPYVSASALPLPGVATVPGIAPESGRDGAPRPLTAQEIHEYVAWYAQAARNAIKAGFDGIEIHGANGYLPDQFLQDVSNERTDQYGGSVENRARFGLEVVDAICKAIGESRAAIRISPWERFNGSGMKDPIPTFSYFVRALRDAHPHFAYVHVTEPRVLGDLDRQAALGSSNDFIRKIWSPKPLISAGGYTRELAVEAAEKDGSLLVAFGRYFISNPDLPKRLEKGIPLTKYDRSTFYTQGKGGYIDYPFAEEDV
ncbi:NADH flavin oxidoreductase/NADH oxidase [Gloeophyllum trabeum ATCC 11539]|uniref:NADH flavin oxidoreductase/NADH oxidase n=1 Tax=Gloeophyllum trabeum (strain ATCC 11539 / FP-39264 / Madison 617) TaxID=670483 RepID=S7PW34_GLOTA|nr:NADH flavin oxidoreductase/NADH oxidase [Gloeophyllum trabeum ATCC 11539]EPQ51522.1 NADH flavin oxidoreductase/NADH oxidase [Gloeophyllum trabeum ATCC 11539]